MKYLIIIIICLLCCSIIAYFVESRSVEMGYLLLLAQCHNQCSRSDTLLLQQWQPQLSFSPLSSYYTSFQDTSLPVSHFVTDQPLVAECFYVYVISLASQMAPYFLNSALLLPRSLLAQVKCSALHREQGCQIECLYHLLT